MFALGIRKPGVEFKLSQNNIDIQNLMFNVGKCRKKWIQSVLLDEYNTYFNTAIGLEYMSESISDFMVHSEALANVSHYDIGDGSPTISTWIEETIDNTKNWFLIFPNVTKIVSENATNPHVSEKSTIEIPIEKQLNMTSSDQPSAIAIQLFQGCTVSWDAKILRHASSRVSYRNIENGTSGGNCEVRKRNR